MVLIWSLLTEEEKNEYYHPILLSHQRDQSLEETIKQQITTTVNNKYNKKYWLKTYIKTGKGKFKRV